MKPRLKSKIMTAGARTVVISRVALLFGSVLIIFSAALIFIAYRG